MSNIQQSYTQQLINLKKYGFLSFEEKEKLDLQLYVSNDFQHLDLDSKKDLIFQEGYVRGVACNDYCLNNQKLDLSNVKKLLNENNFVKFNSMAEKLAKRILNQINKLPDSIIIIHYNLDEHNAAHTRYRINFNYVIFLLDYNWVGGENPEDICSSWE